MHDHADLETTLDLLSRLVQFPTVSASSNLDLIRFIETYLSDRGFACLIVHDDTGAKAGILARLGPAEPGGIMLSGHTDVVPVTGQPWTRDPFRASRADGRIYGRGTTDMKGFLAAMLAAADRAAGLALQQPLKLAFSWDEEIGCVGIPILLRDLESSIGKPSLCIVGEPTSMRIAAGHKGKVALRATCRGTSGHSAMAPNYLNAIHLAAEFVGRLRALQDELRQHGAREEGYDFPYATVHVGRIDGGTALNIVPDDCAIDLEIRYPSAQSVEAIRADVEAAARAIADRWREAFPSAAIELETLTRYPGLGVAESDPAVALLRRFAPGAELIKVGFGTEAGCFVEAGVPTLVCGPGSMDQGHTPDEFIELSELAACNAMCDRVLRHLCGEGA